MRIAVIFESQLQAGGGFQHELTIARLLARHQNVHEFVFYATNQDTVRILQNENTSVSLLKMGNLTGRLTKLYRILKNFLKSGDILIEPFEKILHHDRIDLVYFPEPSGIAAYLKQLNYVITAWDQCHRDHPEFPELKMDSQFEQRENFYRNVVPQAVAVLVDASMSKDNLVKRYGCDAMKVHVASFLPSQGTETNPDIDIKKKYGITKEYIFYPAQFWAHKNHVYVLDGLNILRHKYNIEIDVVFSGADKGNLQYVLSCARKLGLEEAVHYVGFIPNEDISSFYRKAIALVMPTYFGPTNIPPLEAFVLGCPVCYSDLPGLRDQVGDAAFLMDLKDASSMAKHVITILDEKELVQRKIKRGREIVSQWTEEDYWKVLKGIFDEYAVKRCCWKS